MKEISHTDLNGDGIGYLKQFDFSKANMSEESRINAVTTVASICVGNTEAKNKIKLYNRLATESVGIPSSSYEFVPVLLKSDQVFEIKYQNTLKSDIELFDIYIVKYGEWVEGGKYLLTNLRALLNDTDEDSLKYYNTLEECKIIAKHFKVFKAKIDLNTARQYMRHRVIWQEISRRYVSGKKQPFEFYLSEGMKALSFFNGGVQDIIDDCVTVYNEAIHSGIKPQEARRILPQAMYTEVYSAWMPSQLQSYLALRTASGTQDEARELAIAKQNQTTQRT